MNGLNPKSLTHSNQLCALEQQVESLHSELEESRWFENHAYELVEHLEAIARGEDLNDVLHGMVTLIESSLSGSKGMIRQRRGETLQTLCAPNLSQAVAASLDNLPLTAEEWLPHSGAFPGESVACLAVPPEGVGACWSAPLEHGVYSAVFATPRKLNLRERVRLERGARLIGLALERYRLQSELRRSEMHYRKLVVDSQVPICQLDKSGTVLYANPAWLKLTGQRPDCLHRPILELFPGHPGEVLAEVLQARRQGLTTTHEMRLGNQQILISGGPLQDHGEGSLESWVDVTEDHRLRFLYGRLAAALEQSSEGVLIVDVDGQIEYSNAALTRSLGFTPEELQGVPLQTLLTPEVPFLEIAEMVERTQSWTGHVKATRRSGASYTGEAVISKLSPHSGGGMNLLVSCRDVTREVELQEQVRTAQKMEAVGQLAGGVAHDFNNLLQVMGGFATLCQDPELSENDRCAMLEEIVKATERAGQLTQQLLAFARKQPMQKGHADLNLVVKSLMRMTERLIGPNIQVDWHPYAQPVPVSVDPAQIEQLLMNLCVNARDAMPSGGRLVVTVERIAEASPSCSFPTPCAVLEVSDSGTGIDPQILPRLFEPFFTTKSAGQGTGLGLAVVYGIVQSHEGSIDVVSSLGKGTTFRVFLPLAADLATPRTLAPEATGEGARQTILVVDDEPKLVAMATRIFEKAGLKVYTASNGVEAVEVFQKYRDEIEAVMLDLIMPRQGGLETWQILEEMRPGLPVLFCSGYMQDACDSLPERDHLKIVTKPYSTTQLVATMRGLLHVGRARS